MVGWWLSSSGAGFACPSPKRARRCCQSSIATSLELIGPDERDGGWPGRTTDVRSVAPSAAPEAHSAADDVTSGGASLVTMVQAADFPECDHVTLGHALHTSGRWRVFRQREMCARSMIVRRIARKDSAQVTLTEYHHVVQAVASD
jgi:hypothetical protein